MANEPTTTIIGNLTDDPELRFTNSSRAVAVFTVASTPRFRRGEQWEDGETLFQRCNLWGPVAENLAGSEGLKRGARVMVHGRLRQRNWEDKEGNKRVSIELEVDEMGASIQFGTVDSFTKTKRSGNRPEQPPPPDDPWAGMQTTGPASSPSSLDDEPPW